MQEYLNALQTVLDKGVPSDDRTGTGTTSYFGMQCRYDLRDGFPLNCCGFWRATPTSPTSKKTGYGSGMNGRMTAAILGRFTATNGGTSRR